MRHLIFVILLIMASDLNAQQPRSVISISGIIVSPDSLAIPDVTIVSSRTGKTIHTNAAGYFKTEMTPGDSLFVYHISFERRYITAKDNGKLIILKPEVQVIKQVNVKDVSKQEQKNLEATMDDIMRLAPMKTLTGYDLHSREDYFILENGSLTRGFSPFFGPTLHIPLEKISSLVKMPSRQTDAQKPAPKIKPEKKNKQKPAGKEKEDQRE